MIAAASAPQARAAGLVPDDPFFGEQWGLASGYLDMPRAWRVTRGDPSAVIAVVDSGVDFGLPDLAPVGWRNPGESGDGRESNAIDDDANGFVDDWRGWDFFANDNDPTDYSDGHGTAVAGVAAARGDNGSAIAGVAWDARVMAIRAGDGTALREPDVVAGVIYAVANGARVVNFSAGADRFSQSLYDAIAAAPGVLFVVPAGNGGDDLIGDDSDLVPDFPCRYELPNLICVAALERGGQLAAFSNYGRVAVDLAAPGSPIHAPARSNGEPAVAIERGTSFAAPHVAGVAALLWSAEPGLPLAQLRARLLERVRRSPDLAGRVASGGALWALGALDVLPPRISGLVVSPRRVRLAGRTANPLVSLRVSEEAQGTLLVERRRGRSWRRVGAMRAGLRRGSNRLRLPVRLRRRLRAPGSYRLIMQAHDFASNRAARRSAGFVIL